MLDGVFDMSADEIAAVLVAVFLEWLRLWLSGGCVNRNPPTAGDRVTS